MTLACQLVELGARLQVTHADEASGRCLSASLDFARAALQQHGIDVELVKWRVVDDPDYCDHWAIALDDALVIDLTHVQVDGQAYLLAPTGGYPSNFRDLRRYPASLLLGPYAAGPAAGEDAHLSSDFAWACGTRLLRFDLAAAWRGRDARAGATAIAEFARFLLRFNALRVIRALERRASTLLSRLPAPAAPSAPSVDAPPAGRPAEPFGGATVRPGGVIWRALTPPQHLAGASVAFTPALTANINSACTLLLVCTSFAPVG